MLGIEFQSVFTYRNQTGRQLNVFFVCLFVCLFFISEKKKEVS